MDTLENSPVWVGLMVLAGIVIVGIVLYFIFGRTTSGGGNGNNPGGPTTVGGLRLSPNTTGGWTLQWDKPTAGTDPISYRYAIGLPPSASNATNTPLQTGTVNTTSVAIDTSRVTLNVPLQAQVTALNSAGTSPAATLNFVLPGGVPNVTGIAPLPGNSSIFLPVPGSGTGQNANYYLAFRATFNNAVTDPSQINVMQNNVDSGNSSGAQSIVLSAPTTADINFCSPPAGCPAMFNNPYGSTIQLGIQATNSIGQGAAFKQQVSQAVAPNAVGNLRVNFA